MEEAKLKHTAMRMSRATFWQHLVLGFVQAGAEPNHFIEASQYAPSIVDRANHICDNFEAVYGEDAWGEG